MAITPDGFKLIKQHRYPEIVNNYVCSRRPIQIHIDSKSDIVMIIIITVIGSQVIGNQVKWQTIFIFAVSPAPNIFMRPRPISEKVIPVE